MWPGAFEDLGTANNVEAFLGLILPKSQASEDEWVFRGQRELALPPIPTIDRPAFRQYRTTRGWSREKHEDRLLTDFKKSALPHVGVHPSGLWEWLAVAQHHGLATRLLDWSANPLAALFFAVDPATAPGDSVAWCYHHKGKSWMSKENKNPFNIKAITSFWPPHVSPRITVQGGCFTAHPDPDAQPTSPRPGDLRRITISQDVRASLRESLLKMGINRASLFPDLDGIARAHNRRLSVDIP
jgi:hypothetical protein